MEKVKYPKVSLLIQGPSNNPDKLSFMEFIPYYKTLFSKIVVSTYTEHRTDSMETFCKENDIPYYLQTEDIGELEKMYNITYHTISTLAPLNAGLITTPYMIKHRVDERYSNLHKLVDLFLEDTEKLVTGATLFTSKASYNYHAGDHLMIGKTDKIKAMMQLTFDNLLNNIFERNAANEPAPEVTFTKNFIIISGGDPTPDNEDKYMRQYFNIISDAELHPFVIRFNTINQTYTEVEHRPDWWKDYQTIEDILTRNSMRI